MDRVFFSSASDMWETPQELFDSLDSVFHFDLDVCAVPENAKCENFFSPDQDGLAMPWYGTCWCNPPYGRLVGRWVKKAFDSYLEGCSVVMLLPSRTDTRWFHDYIYGIADIYFLRGRLKFGGSKSPAPFPSMVVVFGGFEDA